MTYLRLLDVNQVNNLVLFMSEIGDDISVY
jgi:hypothetical protein